MGGAFQIDRKQCSMAQSPGEFRIDRKVEVGASFVVSSWAAKP
jgi:hypothetical protein